MRPHSSTAAAKSTNLVSQFLTYIALEKGLSKTTIASYHFDLAKLESWARTQRKSLLELTRQDLRQWMVALMHDWGLGQRSAKRAISAARGFFQYLVLDRHINRNPAEGICTPVLEQRIPRFLTEEETE